LPFDHEWVVPATFQAVIGGPVGMSKNAKTFEIASTMDRNHVVLETGLNFRKVVEIVVLLLSQSGLSFFSAFFAFRLGDFRVRCRFPNYPESQNTRSA